MSTNNVFYFSRGSATDLRQRFAAALASDQTKPGTGDDSLPFILLPASMLLDFGNLMADITIHWLGGGVVCIQDRTRFLFSVPKR